MVRDAAGLRLLSGWAMNGFRGLCAALVLSGPMLLGACMPIPVLPSGDRPGSRGNLPDAVPGFVVAGRTTRAQVLLRLGEPDHRGPHDSCFVFVRESERGGIAFIVGGPMSGHVVGTPITFTILTLGFNEDGIVAWSRLRIVVRRAYIPHMSKASPAYADCPE